MEYVSLYRRFRPDAFDKVIGQEHIVRTLTNQIKNNRIGHAYLFTGTRGTGKTSCAKIFARAVNCLSPVNGSPCGKCAVCRELSNPSNIDIIEIDAASNNGVDEIRELKENAQYRPAIGRYKVYIIDEVHMLSISAFNALLKTLEEPPEHVIFILATTEVHKLPQTILSRCTRFDFRLVGRDELVGLLKRIFGELGVEYDEKALSLIASGGEGSVRDTLSLADMCLSFGGNRIAYDDVIEVMCATDFSALDELAGAILDGDTGRALKLASNQLFAGRNNLGKDLASYFVNLLNIKNISGYIPDGLTENDVTAMRKRGESATNYRISRTVDIMCALEGELRYSTQPKILVEAAIVRACEMITDVSVEGLTERIRRLEKEIEDLRKNGVVVEKPVEVQAPVVAETPIDPPVEKKRDINAILSEIADEEVEIVFSDDRAKSEGDVYKANSIWGKVVERLTDSDRYMLKMAVQNSEDIECVINDDKFIVKTFDAAVLETFNQPENKRFLNALINELSDARYEFCCIRNKEDDDGIPPEDRMTLDRLFNGEIQIRKKK